jgi:antitoxin (DNA-binding transcriptional repressor) of toxin-antitoxin stability system
MPTVSLQEAQARLPNLIADLKPGEELVVTQDDKPVARIVGVDAGSKKRIAGRGKGKLISYIEDNEYLKEFKEYMP